MSIESYNAADRLIARATDSFDRYRIRNEREMQLGMEKALFELDKEQKTLLINDHRDRISREQAQIDTLKAGINDSVSAYGSRFYKAYGLGDIGTALSVFGEYDAQYGIGYNYDRLQQMTNELIEQGVSPDGKGQAAQQLAGIQGKMQSVMYINSIAPEVQQAYNGFLEALKNKTVVRDDVYKDGRSGSMSIYEVLMDAKKGDGSPESEKAANYLVGKAMPGYEQSVASLAGGMYVNNPGLDNPEKEKIYSGFIRFGSPKEMEYNARVGHAELLMKSGVADTYAEAAKIMDQKDDLYEVYKSQAGNENVTRPQWEAIYAEETKALAENAYFSQIALNPVAGIGRMMSASFTAGKPVMPAAVMQTLNAFGTAHAAHGALHDGKNAFELFSSNENIINMMSTPDSKKYAEASLKRTELEMELHMMSDNDGIKAMIKDSTMPFQTPNMKKSDLLLQLGGLKQTNELRLKSGDLSSEESERLIAENKEVDMYRNTILGNMKYLIESGYFETGEAGVREFARGAIETSKLVGPGVRSQTLIGADMANRLEYKVRDSRERKYVSIIPRTKKAEAFARILYGLYLEEQPSTTQEDIDRIVSERRKLYEQLRIENFDYGEYINRRNNKLLEIQQQNQIITKHAHGAGEFMAFMNKPLATSSHVNISQKSEADRELQKFEAVTDRMKEIRQGQEFRYESGDSIALENTAQQ